MNCFRGDQSHPSGSGPRWRRHYGGGQFLRGIISGTARRAVEEAPDDKDLNCYSPLKSQGTFETGTPSTCPALEMPRSSATSWGCSTGLQYGRGCRSRRSRRPLPPIEPTTMMQLRCSGVKRRFWLIGEQVVNSPSDTHNQTHFHPRKRATATKTVNI